MPMPLAVDIRNVLKGGKVVLVLKWKEKLVFLRFYGEFLIKTNTTLKAPYK